MVATNHQRTRSRLAEKVLIGSALFFCAFSAPDAENAIGQAYHPVVSLAYQYGRYIAVLLLSLLVFPKFFVSQGSLYFSRKNSFYLILIILSFFSMKELYYGHLILFLQFLAVGTLMVLVFDFYLASLRAEVGVVGSINFVSDIFLIFGLLVCVYCISNTFLGFSLQTTFHGRLFGMTANPQHMMMNCVLALIGPTYSLFFRGRSAPAIKILSSVVIVGLSVIVLMTGSRAGIALLATIFTLAILYSRSILMKGSFILALPMFVIVFLPPEVLSAGWSLFTGVFEGRADTRSWVWEREILEFWRNPVFGVPIEYPDRLLFSESYWLSSLSNGGAFIGFLLIALLFSLLNQLYRLVFSEKMSQIPHGQRFFLLSGILVVLLVSVFEAVLAAYFSSHTLISVMLISLSSICIFGIKRPPQKHNVQTSLRPFIRSH